MRERTERKAMGTLITKISWQRNNTILVVIRLDIIENWISVFKIFLKKFRFLKELALIRLGFLRVVFSGRSI